MKTRWLVTAATALALGFAGSANAADDVAAGKAKAKSCVGCHGADGQGTKNGSPLATLSKSEIAQALKEYKSGKRQHTTMNALAKNLSDTDIANLAAYLASL
jgi:cytochrome c553